MERNNKKIILEYTITFGVCLILSFLVAVFQGLFKPYAEVVAKTNWNIVNENQKIFFTLTNGCFSIGVVAVGLGLLVMASNGGAFDFIVYGIRRFISLFQKDINKIKYKTYYDYHMAKEGREKKSFLYMVFVGLFFIGLSLLFLVLYYNT